MTEAYGKPIWEVLAERPEQCETFQRAMTNSTSVAANAIVEAYDFSGIKRLADVGGGHGLLLAAILRANPKCRACCSIVPRWWRMCQGSVRRLRRRIAIEAGSFFERVPDGCDAYFSSTSSTIGATSIAAPFST